MGIDFPTTNELIGGRSRKLYGENYMEEIKKQIGADTLIYQTIGDLISAIGLNRNQLCLACLTGNYPIKSVEKLAQMEESIVKSRNQ